MPAHDSRLNPIDRIAAALYRGSGGGVPDLILKRLGVVSPRRRIEFHTLATLIAEKSEIPGAVIECGTYRGGTLLGMTHLIRRKGLRPRIYGLDSFEGFPEPVQEDAQPDGHFHADVHRGALADTSYEDLLARIRLLGWDGQIRLLKGFFEATLPQLASERFSLAHIDCDLYQSYMTCLEFLYPRMLPGSVMVFDDYRLPANVYPGADRAVDEFLADKPEKPERLPGPNGLRSFIRIARREPLRDVGGSAPTRRSDQTR